MFRRFALLTKIVEGKTLFALSNLYFFNLARGIQMDFVVVFHLVLVPDFANVFLVKDATTKHKVYLTEESGLDV
jgi:hypothetical protein